MVGSTYIDQFKKGHYENLHLSIAAQWIAAGVFFKLFGKGFWFLQLSLPHYLRLMYLFTCPSGPLTRRAKACQVRGPGRHRKVD